MGKRDRAGNELPVAVADQAIDNGIVSPIELNNTTCTRLDQLNDHCLLEIFTNRSLTPIDLCSLSMTCKRFKQLVQSVFPKKFAIKHDLIGYKFKSKRHPQHNMNQSDVERVLENFGSRLSALSVYRWDKQLVNLIAKYYDDISLKRLAIHNDCINRETLVYCWDLVWPIEQLVQLEIFLEIEAWLKLAISRHTFPLLEHFTFYGKDIYFRSRDTVESELFLKFIERHKGLKLVALHMNSITCSGKFVETIINSCNKLEQLTLRGLHILPDEDGINLQSGHKLKVLTFASKHTMVHTALLQTLTFIELVKIPDVRFASAETYDALSQVQTLRELRLCRGNFGNIPWTKLIQIKKLHLREPTIEFEGIHAVNIIRELHNLEEFEFDGDNFADMLFELQLKEFHEIVKVVEQQRREHVLKLICQFNFNCSEHCHDYGKVKLTKPYMKK